MKLFSGHQNEPSEEVRPFFRTEEHAFPNNHPSLNQSDST